MTITDRIIPKNNYNRPGKKSTPKRICVHYTGSVGSSAAALTKYYENVAKGVFREQPAAWTSTQYIVGIEGEIIRIIPDNEIAYAAASENKDTIHIEVCYKAKSGEFTEKSVAALSELVQSLMKKYGIGADKVLRHYDLTGKHCPIYYVDEGRWKALHSRITANKLYRVQVGAFSDRKNAEAYAVKLKKAGYSTIIV